jgi:hypothetical protein
MSNLVNPFNNVAELSNLTEEQKRIYEENLIQYWGMKSALETAVEEREIEIARKAIIEGLSNDLISKLTNLAIEQIEKLRAEAKK